MEFSFKGLKLRVPDSVYYPAEDSFMLADGSTSLRGDILEVGCGSGIASLCCANSSKKNKVLGVDINPKAVLCSRNNAKLNHIKNASFKISNLFSKVPKKKFDAIIFNPPYLPTAESELIEGPLNYAFDGGEDGRKVLEQFLQKFDAYIKPNGALLLIQSSLNDENKTTAKLESLHYKVNRINEEKFFFERIFLIHAIKPRF